MCPAASMALRGRAVVCSALRNGLKYLQMFLSSLFSSLGYAAYASVPVIAALTIRERKINRPWLHSERANQNPRSADQFAIIAFSLNSISVLLLPLNEYLPLRCPAPPRTFPKGTSEVRRLCSPCLRILGMMPNFRRFCLYQSSASVSSNDDALFKMMSFAVSAVWSGISYLMNESSAKPLHDPSTFEPSIPAKGADSIMDGGV